jgi:hypothetical protein
MEYSNAAAQVAAAASIAAKRSKKARSNISSRATPNFAQRLTLPQTLDALLTSTNYNSANIGLISKAIKAIRLQELRNNILVSKYAAKYSVD